MVDCPPKENADRRLMVLNSVRELLECPFCHRAIYPPIYQCSNGHTICSTCKPKVQNRCFTCRNELGDIRCLALEKVAASLMFPCKYQSLGCAGVHPCQCKLVHESQCSFRPYNCPYANFSKCTVAGNIPHLVDHLVQDHEAQVHERMTFNCRYQNPQDVKKGRFELHIFSCFEQFFCLHFGAFQLGTVSFYRAFIEFMGEDNEAEKYKYRLEARRDERKLIWEGIPLSIRVSYTMVDEYGFNGLMIERNMAHFYSDGNGKELNLTVTGIIWKAR